MRVEVGPSVVDHKEANIVRQEARLTRTFKELHPEQTLDGLREKAEPQGDWMAVLPTVLDQDKILAQGRLIWAGDNLKKAREYMLREHPNIVTLWFGTQTSGNDNLSQLEMVLRSL